MAYQNDIYSLMFAAGQSLSESDFFLWVSLFTLIVTTCCSFDYLCTSVKKFLFVKQEISDEKKQTTTALNALVRQRQAHDREGVDTQKSLQNAKHTAAKLTAEMRHMKASYFSLQDKTTAFANKMLKELVQVRTKADSAILQMASENDVLMTEVETLWAEVEDVEYDAKSIREMVQNFLNDKFEKHMSEQQNSEVVSSEIDNNNVTCDVEEEEEEDNVSPATTVSEAGVVAEDDTTSLPAVDQDSEVVQSSTSYDSFNNSTSVVPTTPTPAALPPVAPSSSSKCRTPLSDKRMNVVMNGSGSMKKTTPTPSPAHNTHNDHGASPLGLVEALNA